MGAQRRRSRTDRGATRSLKNEQPHPAPNDASQRLLHELHVHQVELEAQNENLRRVQEDLEVSQARYVDLYEMAPVGYFTLDQRGIVLAANLRATVLLGVGRYDLIRHPWFRWVCDADVDNCHRYFRRVVDGSDMQSCEIRMQRPSGERIWVRLDATAAQSPDGSATTYRMTMSDITERKHAEEERERLSAQLAHAEKMESVGRLAGGVAHDFNNMLTVINGYAGMIAMNTASTDPIRLMTEAILSAGESAAALVSQLLAFSRRQRLEPQRLDLNKVVARARVMFERSLGEQIKLAISLAPDIDEVVADYHQLEQVVVNLALNARDAMPDGGLLTIQTRRMELSGVCPDCGQTIVPGPYVRLSVLDTGVGISPEVLSHLFEPFFTTKELGRGTGLGLASVHGIVTQSGGHLQVESKVGQGTAFHVSLPAARRGAHTVDRHVPGDGDLRGSETILVVEDQPEVRRLTATLLKGSGYQVLQAADAGEALAVCARNPIDLLLTDVAMPGTNGPALAMQVCNLYPGTKVLLMSGYPPPGAGVDELPPGTGFIGKPFEARELCSVVRRTLGLTGAQTG